MSDAATTPATDLNNPALAGGGEEWPEGDLPEQFGGERHTIMPGQHTFLLPVNLAQLWKDKAFKYSRPYLANGQPNPDKDKQVTRKTLRFDANAPLVLVGGKQDGLPMRATITTNPRPRGRKDDPKTAWVSDAAYLLSVSCADATRPTTPEELVAAINKYAGKQIRLETGFTAECRADKVRYIEVTTQEPGHPPVTTVVQDPSGQKGCGKRYNNRDFKNPAAQNGSGYDTEILCTCGEPKPEEAAQGKQPVNVVLRAFENIERFLAPLAQAAPTA